MEKTPTTVAELMLRSAAGSSAADNILDMIDAKEVSRDDAKRIGELWMAHSAQERNEVTK